MLIFQKKSLYYPHQQITRISHRTKTVVTAILYASVLGMSCLLARDHAIFTCKIVAKLILITHFTNLIPGTKSSAKDNTGKVYVAPVICFFFSIYYEPFTSDDYLFTLFVYHFLTTVDTAFVLWLCERSATRPKLNQSIKWFSTFVSEWWVIKNTVLWQ